MPLSATGLLSTPVAALENLIASSATFRTLTGAANATAAKAFIHYQEAHDKLDPDNPEHETAEQNPKPRALIAFPEGWMVDRQGPGSWRDPGMLDFGFEFPIPDAHRFTTAGDYKEEFKYFSNLIGAIIAEMEANSGGIDGSDPYLNVSRLEMIQSPMPCDEDDANGYYWGCAFRATWPG